MGKGGGVAATIHAYFSWRSAVLSTACWTDTGDRSDYSPSLLWCGDWWGGVLNVVIGSNLHLKYGNIVDSWPKTHTMDRMTKSQKTTWVDMVTQPFLCRRSVSWDHGWTREDVETRVKYRDIELIEKFFSYACTVPRCGDVVKLN